jgi:hypothetical protein
MPADSHLATGINGVTAALGQMHILNGIIVALGQIHILNGVIVALGQIHILNGVIVALGQMYILNGVIPALGQMHILNGVIAALGQIHVLNGVIVAFGQIHILARTDGYDPLLSRAMHEAAGLLTCHASAFVPPALGLAHTASRFGGGAEGGAYVHGGALCLANKGLSVCLSGRPSVHLPACTVRPSPADEMPPARQAAHVPVYPSVCLSIRVASHHQPTASTLRCTARIVRDLTMPFGSSAPGVLLLALADLSGKDRQTLAAAMDLRAEYQVCLSACLPACLPAIRLAGCLSVHLSVRPSVWASGWCLPHPRDRSVRRSPGPSLLVWMATGCRPTPGLSVCRSTGWRPGGDAHPHHRHSVGHGHRGRS